MTFIISDPKLARVEVLASSPKQLENLPHSGHIGAPELATIITLTLGLTPLAVAGLWPIADGLLSFVHVLRMRRMIITGRVKVVAKKGVPEFLALPLEVIEEAWKLKTSVKVVLPELTNIGSLNYVQTVIDVYDLAIPKSDDAQVAALKTIASVVKERFPLIDQLAVLEHHCLEVEQVRRLVQSSDLYASQATLLKKLQHQQKQAVAKIQALIELQDKYIRERLITARINALNLDEISEHLPLLDAQFQQLQQQYQETRDFVNAYWEVKNHHLL